MASSMTRLLGGGFEAGLDAEDAENEKKGKSYDYAWMAQNRANRNAAWEHVSLDTVERAQKAEAEQRAADYKPVHPWTKTSVDRVQETHLANQARDYNFSKPWDCPAGDADREMEEDLNKQMEAIAAAAAYSTTCPWKPEEMTDKQKKAIADYKYTTPYHTKYSEPAPAEKSHKRRILGKDPYAPTVKPWELGKQPLPPQAKESHPQPATSLWEAPLPRPTDPAIAAMESSGDPILDNLRMQLKKKGASGILGLSRKFKIMDDDNSGTLCLEEFTKALRECEVADLSKQAIGHLFRYFDRDDSGSVTYDEFLVGIRGVLNPRRRALVALAFDVLDKDKSGEVTLDDIREAYDATGHPDVLRGARTLDEVLVEFLGSFEKGGAVDGIVTYDEFENYYSNVSASIDLDDYFELMIRNAWHISGGEGWCANTTNKRVLVTHADGTQTVEEVRDDVGLKQGDKKGERLLRPGGSSAVGGTDGARGRGGGGSQQLEELQRRAADLGLVDGATGSGNSSNGRNSVSNHNQSNNHSNNRSSNNTHASAAAPLKPQSLAAALNQQSNPYPDTTAPHVPPSSSSVSSRQPSGGAGYGPPPVVVRPVPAPAPAPAPVPGRPSAPRSSLSVNGGSLMSGGSRDLNNNKPKSLSAHLNY